MCCRELFSGRSDPTLDRHAWKGRAGAVSTGVVPEVPTARDGPTPCMHQLMPDTRACEIQGLPDNIRESPPRAIPIQGWYTLYM